MNLKKLKELFYQKKNIFHFTRFTSLDIYILDIFVEDIDAK